MAQPTGKRGEPNSDQHNDVRDRQTERMRRAVDRKAENSRSQAEQQGRTSADRPAEQRSVRAKSSGHKKKTADKWNQ